MGATYPELNDRLIGFIANQRMFFVATAPLSASGRVNVSPKGLDSLRVLSPTCVAYTDFTGSGIETIAHVRENGRLTIMFCAVDGAPSILRLQGGGRVVEPRDAEFARLLPRFSVAPDMLPSVRALIVLDITRIADSCGFGVPLYDYRGEREQLTLSAQRKGANGLCEYRAKKNTHSIDGLPGLGG